MLVEFANDRYETRRCLYPLLGCRRFARYPDGRSNKRNSCNDREVHFPLKKIAASSRCCPVRRILSLIGLGHGSCFVDDNDATFHDPANIVQNDVDVRKRIAFDGDNVGEETGCYRTQVLFHSEHFGLIDRRGLERLLIGH